MTHASPSGGVCIALKQAQGLRCLSEFCSSTAVVVLMMELWYQYVLFFFSCGKCLKWAWNVIEVWKWKSRRSSWAICETFAIAAIKVLSYVCSLLNLKRPCVLCFAELALGLPMRCSCTTAIFLNSVPCTSWKHVQSSRLLEITWHGRLADGRMQLFTLSCCTVSRVVCCRFFLSKKCCLTIYCCLSAF